LEPILLWEITGKRDITVTRYLPENIWKKTAGEHPEFAYTLFLNGRLAEWAPSPHFGIELKTHTANIVGTPEMEQSLLATAE
jgi:hypothetical protein